MKEKMHWLVGLARVVMMGIGDSFRNGFSPRSIRLAMDSTALRVCSKIGISPLASHRCCWGCSVGLPSLQETPVSGRKACGWIEELFAVEMA